jgi:hypothetical protein
MTMPGSEPASNTRADASRRAWRNGPPRGEIYSPASLQEARTGGICQAASPSIRSSKRPKTVRP